jgi:hypothetical protein
MIWLWYDVLRRGEERSFEEVICSDLRMSGFHAPAFITPLLSTERKKMLLGRTADLSGHLTLSLIARQLLGTSNPSSQVQIDFRTSPETQDSEIQESVKYIGLGMSVLGKSNACKKLGVDVTSGYSSSVDSTTGLDIRRVACARRIAIAWLQTSRKNLEMRTPSWRPQSYCLLVVHCFHSKAKLQIKFSMWWMNGPHFKMGKTNKRVLN